ncbi:MAG: hypothetical protein ACOYEC_02695 [Christensenellales bacterium]|nr:hypothetical protein [Clostridiales bacterium]
MYKALIKINKKDYFACSMYYIKKYISAREIILLLLLLAAGLALFISFDNIIILVMFAVILALMGFAVILFVVTALAGFKTDYQKYDITEQLLTFDQKELTIESINSKGQTSFIERLEYRNIDKVALRKDRIYLYGGVALPFYIFPAAMKQGSYEDLRLFLIDNIEPSKFKMKTKMRYFPFYPKRKFDQDLQQKLDNIDQNLKKAQDDDQDQNKK